MERNFENKPFLIWHCFGDIFRIFSYFRDLFESCSLNLKMSTFKIPAKFPLMN